MLDSYSRSPGPQRLRSCKVAKTEARMKLCIEDLVRKVLLWGYLVMPSTLSKDQGLQQTVGLSRTPEITQGQSQ